MGESKFSRNTGMYFEEFVSELRPHTTPEE